MTKLGPGSLQSWAGDIIAILREAHQAVEAARARGSTALDPQVLAGRGNATTLPCPRGSSTTGCGTGTAADHPGYALGCWLRGYKEQVFLFTRTSPSTDE